MDQEPVEEFNLTSDGEFRAVKSLVLGRVQGKRSRGRVPHAVISGSLWGRCRRTAHYLLPTFSFRHALPPVVQPGGRRLKRGQIARLIFRSDAAVELPKTSEFKTEFCRTIIQSSDFNPVRGAVAPPLPPGGADLRHVLIDLPCAGLEKGREERGVEALIGSVMTCSCSL